MREAARDLFSAASLAPRRPDDLWRQLSGSETPATYEERRWGAWLAASGAKQNNRSNRPHRLSSDSANFSIQKYGNQCVHLLSLSHDFCKV